MILLAIFFLVSFLKPSNHLDKLHDQLQSKYHIVISEVPTEEKEVVIPSSDAFDKEPWSLKEQAVNKVGQSLSKYQDQELQLKIYYIFDSPYHQMLVFPDINIYLNVYLKNNRVVAYYYWFEDNPDVAHPVK